MLVTISKLIDGDFKEYSIRDAKDLEYPYTLQMSANTRGDKLPKSEVKEKLGLIVSDLPDNARVMKPKKHNKGFYTAFVGSKDYTSPNVTKY